MRTKLSRILVGALILTAGTATGIPAASATTSALPCSVYANPPFAYGVGEIRGIGGSTGCGETNIEARIYQDKVGLDALVATGSGSNPIRVYGSCNWGHGNYYTQTISRGGTVESQRVTLC
ncbi:hypothetical protein [Nonomuraea sp. NEAU-A123]|uniref:hypothetical protein n=1 Tax=Nonomuraea sp. NEAU-A123 TaxID=2839649 RepID=UPI001BE4DAF7|nr:hypothetical protein [Nonomuraea sp. NEAU-A123]MBT2224865.1 hypothetical protein [Nonomuraea sp. NEAU-A123]